MARRFYNTREPCLHDGLPIDIPTQTTKHIRYRYREHMFAVRSISDQQGIINCEISMKLTLYMKIKV